LYEAVTGQKPFNAETQFGVLDAHLHADAAPPVALRPDVPPALNDAILKAMARDPFARYDTAKQFWEALQAVKLRETKQADENAGRAGAGLRDVPNAATAETRSPGSRVLYKVGVPLGVGAVLIALLVILLSHSFRGRKSPAIVPGPINAPFLSLASGDMVYVAGGEALLGAELKRVLVGSFYIDKTEVTNRAFLDFCRATSRTPPRDAERSPGDYPVVNVSIEDARSFCGWAGKRLPTAEEWEKAARGPNGQLYPWGSGFDYGLANLPRDTSAAKTAKLASAMAYESGKSPYGALNMLGNAWEWVNAAAHAPTGEEFRNYQKTFRDLVPPLSATEPFYYARGGCYAFALPADTPAAVFLSDPGIPLPARARKPDVGFRCAMDAKN
jgi:formylglycine-generating enzyme required for sulfatase activity